jgi:hypothetical protein
MEEVLLGSNLGTEDANDEDGFRREATSLLSLRNSRQPAEDRFESLAEEGGGWRFSESLRISSLRESP